MNVQAPGFQSAAQPRLRNWSNTTNTAQASLMMSDYWFLFSLLLALFYVADPFRLSLEKIGITKHLPLMIGFAGILLGNIGNWLFRTRDNAPRFYWQVLGAGLPLILLGLWIVGGSLYARKFEGITNSFVTVGLYMLFGLFTARLIMLSPARASIVRIYLKAAALTAAFMILFMAATFGNKEFSYHELEGLVIPIAAYFALRPLKNNLGNRHWNAFLTLFFLAGGLTFNKNTGFIVIALTMLYLWLAEWRFRFRENLSFRFWTMLWVIVLFIGGVAAEGYLAHQRGQLLPSGNPQYRMLTYEVAINRFYESPVWGTGFTKPATEKFKAYEIDAARGILPTHSDVLDLAAQGGTIALALWIWGYLRIMRLSLRHTLSVRPREDMHAAAHALACMSLAGIIVYAFNPILLQPAKAILVWGQLGMLLGITLHLKSQQPVQPAVPRKAPLTGPKVKQFRNSIAINRPNYEPAK